MNKMRLKFKMLIKVQEMPIAMGFTKCGHTLIKMKKRVQRSKSRKNQNLKSLVLNIVPQASTKSSFRLKEWMNKDKAYGVIENKMFGMEANLLPLILIY